MTPKQNGRSRKRILEWLSEGNKVLLGQSESGTYWAESMPPERMDVTGFGLSIHEALDHLGRRLVKQDATERRGYEAPYKAPETADE